MKIKHLILFIATFILLPTNINAICSYEKISKYKTLASNVNYDYLYKDVKDDVAFSIRFVNVDAKLSVHDKINNKKYLPDANGQIIINNLLSNKQYPFEININDPEFNKDYITVKVPYDGGYIFQELPVGSGETVCENDTVSYISINLPAYNKYYNSDVCKNFSEYKLCQRWYKNEMNYSEFEKNVLQAKKEQEKQELKKETEQNKTEMLELIFNFVKENIVYCVGFTITLIFGIVIYIKKRGEKDFEGWK